MPDEKSSVNVDDPVEKLKKDLDHSIHLERRKKIAIGCLLFVVVLIAARYYYLSFESSRLGLGDKPVMTVLGAEEKITDIPVEEIAKEPADKKSGEEDAKENLGDIIEVEDPFEAIIQAEMKKEAESSGSSPAVSDNNGRQYAVQVGAFKIERNSLTFAEDLRNKGYEVSVIIEKFENGQLLHRLLVGRFSSKERALEELRSLTEKEGLEGYVTPL